MVKNSPNLVTLHALNDGKMSLNQNIYRKFKIEFLTIVA